MTSNGEIGPGVSAGRARVRRLWMLIVAVAVVVAGIDATLHAIRYHAPSGGYSLPPFVAIGSAVLLVWTLLGGSWLYLRLTDELDVHDNLIAFSVGFLFNISAYIIWVMLFLGGLAIPPAANWLFLSTGVAAGLAYGWIKIRRMVSA